MFLTIELVPATCWYSNVRSEVSPAEWGVIRTDTCQKANYKCEICGGKGPKHPVECHEIWEYDDSTLTQTLMGFIALCPACHEVKHIGLAATRGRKNIATLHLAKVNKISLIEADKYIEDAFEIWEHRSHFKWKLDISFLETFKESGW